jgi:signal transduction histidine kinase
MALVLSLACAGGVKDEDNASGPGQQLSLDEYFHELSTAFDRLEQATEGSAQPPDPRSVGAPEELLMLFQDSIADLEGSAVAFINEVEGLKPPQEAADAHQEFLEALRSDYERISALAKDVREAESVEAATSAVLAGAAPLAASREPCRNLQSIAEEHNIGVELPCEE